MEATKLRVNPMGLQFKLIGNNLGETTEVFCETNGKKLTIDANLFDISQAWYHWQNGQYIQKAFHFLTPSQREFLMTGITPTEWDEMFKEDDDEKTSNTDNGSND